MTDYFKIYRKLYNPLCNYACTYIQDIATAEDLVQDVFIDCITNQRLENVMNPEGYLFKAVKYACYDYYKHHQSMLTIDSFTINISDTASEDAELSKIYTYIKASLPTKTRQVFLLHREEGHSYQQIAEKMGISVKTVENQMARAIRISRRILKKLDLI